MTDVRLYKTTSSGATLSINMIGATTSLAANTVGNHTAFATVNADITGAGVVALNGTNFMAATNGSGSMRTNLSAGAVLDVQSGSWAWGYTKASAATNLGSLNVASGAEYRNSDASFRFDALTGSGTIGPAYSAAVTLTLGVNNTTNNATYGVSGNTATFSGTIINGDSYTGVTTGALSLVKTGTGTQVLSGIHSYTGSTTVNNGTLIVNGNISTSTLTTVQTGATLGGTGTVAAATINGILAPGNSIGTLNATGDVTWNDNDAWVFELGSGASTLGDANTTPGLSDLLDITGAGNDFLKGTGSSFTFDFVAGGTTGWYKLVDWTSATTFAAGNFFATNLSSGLTGEFTVDSGTSALYLNVIPEPNVAALLGSFGMLALLRRRRN